MSKYTLKSVVQRGSMFGAVLAIIVATFAPASSVFADALNPLTQRSLMLSSSAPGYTDTDGSGNSFAFPNSIGENYAPAGSGPNGKKTGETLSFKVSSTKDIQAFTMQYCTGAAGKCRSPGNDLGDARIPSGAGSRDSNAVSWPNQKSDLEVLPGFTQTPSATPPAPGEFQIYVNGTPSTLNWTFATTNKEDTTHADPLSGKNNYITLKTTGTDAETLTNGDLVKIVFVPSETIYITNPGAKEFFVKLNTYDSNTSGDIVPGGSHNIDGGVTVANVMTDSIHITTKVLETMSFSVGTRDRNTVTLNCADPSDAQSIKDGCEATSGASHRTCDPIQNINNNRLNLGDPDGEYSLQTGKAWDVNSYWRLSSNSSGGATVYYSGNTLANTVGDEIHDVPSETISTPGTEQFGLGFVAPDAPSAEFNTEHPGITVSSMPFITLNTQSGAGFPAPQTAATDYDEATGTLDNGSGGAGTAKFKFKKTSLQIPEMIAQENTDVISCATAKMRYVGNIAPDTPAGVYTTKINYLAAPQY